jgi:hypothetical protein
MARRNLRIREANGVFRRRVRTRRWPTWALGLDQPIGPQDTVVAYGEGNYRNVLS